MRSGYLSLSLLVAGCLPTQSHVVLQAPSPEAPFEERLAAYQRLRPDEVIALSSTALSADQRAESGSVVFVLLSDGTIVEEPDDLLPVVGPDSETAQQAERYRRLKSRGLVLLYSGEAAFAFGGLSLLAFVDGPLSVAGDVGLGVGLASALTGIVLYAMSETPRVPRLAPRSPGDLRRGADEDRL
jgi:hypothetical protein